MDLASQQVEPRVIPEPERSTPDLRADDTVADLIQDLLQGEAAGKIPSPKSKIQNPESHWYLGIDIGTTGISAVLMQRNSGQFYPVYWHEDQAGADCRFRLPAVLSLTADDGKDLCLQDFKPWLKLGIPYHSPQTQQWQPVLQWSDSQTVPLHWMQQALQTLLTTLKQPGTAVTCGAWELNASEFSSAIDRLAGVIVGYPSNWSDTYSFNLREAVLGARLVDHPEQVFLIEDTIAALLSVLRQEPENTPPPSSPHPQPNVVLQNADWQGNTLILNAGATVTELALVNLPDQMQELQYSDFHIRSLPLAGDAIDQDIVCHLLYPLLQQADASAAASPGRVDLSWDAVELTLELEPLPAIGQPDLPNRYRLRQRLAGLRSGQILLDAARSLKLAFHQQSRFTLQLGDRRVTILRQDLGSRILLPYVQRLNRELNALLQETSTAVDTVNQVICTGGTASIRAIGRWLHEKFPNATITQDTYTARFADQCLPSCSRVAYGLAALPLYAQVLDRTHHQYSDYFLLLALLRSLPDRSVTFNEIRQGLEQQGVDVNNERCQLHLLALLEGHLPPGLIATEPDTLLFATASRNSSEFAEIASTPLCQKQGDYYRPNLQQRDRLQQLLTTILHTTHQQLDTPYGDRLTREVEQASLGD